MKFIEETSLQKPWKCQRPLPEILHDILRSGSTSQLLGLLCSDDYGIHTVSHWWHDEIQGIWRRWLNAPVFFPQQGREVAVSHMSVVLRALAKSVIQHECGIHPTGMLYPNKPFPSKRIFLIYRLFITCSSSLNISDKRPVGGWRNPLSFFIGTQLGSPSVIWRHILHTINLSQPSCPK